MKQKTVNIIILSVLAVCVILTAAHIAYSVYAYHHASIIQFIAKEIW